MTTTDYLIAAHTMGSHYPYNPVALAEVRVWRVKLLSEGLLTPQVAAAAACAAGAHTLGTTDRRSLTTTICGDAPPRGTRIAVDHAAKLREARIERNAPVPAPVPVSRRWLYRQIRAAYREAGYRTTKHGHSSKFRIAGEASISSSTTQQRPSAVGLPNAYAKQAFWVATSAHTITVAPDWCGAVRARGAAVVGGLLTLDLARQADPSVPGERAYRAIWVEQGRGTEIRKVNGWLVRTLGGWVHADTARTAARIAFVATPAPRPEATPLPTEPRALLRRARLQGGEIVVRRHAEDAGHCNAGIRDWLAKHDLDERTEITAEELATVACASGDRLREVYLVLLAAGRAARRVA
jgi:hypothetical protein